jgi:hypothetical protein
MDHISTALVKYVLADMLKDRDKLNLFVINHKFNSYISDIFINENIYKKFPSEYSNNTFKIRSYFTHTLPTILPNYIKYLRLELFTNTIIDLSILPSTLRILLLGGKFNQSVNNLPSTITDLILGDNFNQSIDNIPSGNLHNLSIGNKFNQSVDKLPLNLHSLMLGNRFNHPINKLPYNLRILLIGVDFNQSVDNLPSNLYFLNLVGYFNQSINNLPSNLKILGLSYAFDWPINKLPDKLKVLYLPTTYKQLIMNFPNSLERLRIRNVATYIFKHKKLKRYTSCSNCNRDIYTIVYKK